MHGSRRVRLAAGTVAMVLVFSPDGPARAGASLPSSTSGHRPGPDILYGSPANAQQLSNAGVWRAPPILVSGTTAYRGGEFLYQDYLYDDHGAAGVSDATALANEPAFAPPSGTATYPTDPVFAANAADLVELRVKSLRRSTALRVTLNTMVDPTRTAVTIAIGTSASPVAWPHGAGVSSPAQLFLTTHGSSAALEDAAGRKLSPAPTAQVSVARRQVSITVPHAAWDPGLAAVRLAAGVGLWDPDAGTYLAPRPGPASADTPGGGIAGASALFNLAFRSSEPTPDWARMGTSRTIADAAAMARVAGGWWRETAQAAALRDGDAGRFSARVDFAKLAARVTDNSAVPTAGVINRIFASHFSSGQGVDQAQDCGRFPTSCRGELVGQLQTYALYVPRKKRPVRGWPLTLLLHAASANHNEYLGSRNQSQIGDQADGRIVLTPGSRGPDGDYTEIAEADAFEAWADVARNYPLDPRSSSIAGYSTGGGGAMKLAQRWPDLFARSVGVAAVVMDGGFEHQWMASLRNVPVMTWIGTADEASGGLATERSVLDLTAHGLRFILDEFLTAEHLTLATNDEYGPVAEFLASGRINGDPPHVTFVVDPRWSFPGARLVADHAYWLSGLRVRSPETAPAALVDARSEGFGLADAPVVANAPSAGVLAGGNHGPMPFVRRQQSWGQVPKRPAIDRLVLSATNLSTATIAMDRAQLTCAALLRVITDGPLRLKLGGCGTTLDISEAGTFDLRAHQG